MIDVRAFRLDRRKVLSRTIAAVGTMAAGSLGNGASAQTVDPWAEAEAIVGRIRLPRIPERSFPVTSFGAIGDGKADCSDAFRRAITAARNAGGGRITVPPGRYVTGPIQLYNKMDLHLEDGSTLLFKNNPSAYLPAVLTRYAAQDCFSYRPLIRAYRRSNVAITGSGVIDGRADNKHWWQWAGDRKFGWAPGQPSQSVARQRLREQGQAGVHVDQRVYGAGSYFRPPLIQPYGCTNVLIEGVTLRNSPWWMVHALFSTNVTIRNVTFESPGPNNDGCDLESSQQVLVEGCTFRQRDDKVVIKSGFGRDGIVGTPGVPFGPRPTRDVVMRHCRVGGFGTALAVGSEIGGGAQRIFAYDVTNGPDDASLLHACMIKSSTYRGGTVSGVWLKDFNVAACDLEALLLTYAYSDEDLLGPYEPRFENINFAGIVCARAQQALSATGEPGLPIAGLRLKDCRFDTVGNTISRVPNVEDFAAENVVVAGAPAQFL